MASSDERIAKSERESERVFAVCDSRSGAVYHIHSVVILGEAEPRDENVIKAEALEFAKAGGEVKGRLTVIEISPTELRSDTDYKLNLKLGRLEPIKQSLPRKTTRKAKPSRSTRGVRTRRSRTGKKR
jgi:hypothetical protein